MTSSCENCRIADCTRPTDQRPRLRHVSTEEQTCARQVAELTEFAARAGYRVEGVYLETGSGAREDRAVRRRVMALAQARKVDLVLVSELSRWGRSTLDLLATLRALEGWGVSLVAQSGMAFDLASPHGRMMATLLAGIAEFERDLIRERVRSGIAAAKARGKVLGRRAGDRPGGPAGPKGAGRGGDRAQLSLDRAGSGNFQEHRDRHRGAAPGRPQPLTPSFFRVCPASADRVPDLCQARPRRRQLRDARPAQTG